METLISRACAYLDKYVYFYTVLEGLPCRVNVETGKTELIKASNVSCLKKVDYISDMISCHNKVYAFSRPGNVVMEYNPENNKITEIPLNCDYFSWGNYALITPYKSNLYIFPRGKKEIVILDCNIRKLQRKSIDVCNVDKFQWGCVSGECAWLFPQYGNKIAYIDFNSLLEEELRLEVEIKDLVHVAEYNGNIFMLMRDASICMLDTKERKASLIRASMGQDAFSRIIATKKKIVLLPALEKDIGIINLENREMTRYHDYPQGFKYLGNKNESKYMGSCVGDRNIRYFAMQSANHILCINTELGDISWIKPQMFSLEEKISYLYKHGVNPILEEKNFLNSFLKVIGIPQTKASALPNIGLEESEIGNE